MTSFYGNLNSDHHTSTKRIASHAGFEENKAVMKNFVTDNGLERSYGIENVADYARKSKKIKTEKVEDDIPFTDYPRNSQQEVEETKEQVVSNEIQLYGVESSATHSRTEKELFAEVDIIFDSQITDMKTALVNTDESLGVAEKNNASEYSEVSDQGMDFEAVLERVYLRNRRLESAGYAKIHSQQGCAAKAESVGITGAQEVTPETSFLELEIEDDASVTSNKTLGRHPSNDGTSDPRITEEEESAFDQDVEIALGCLLTYRSYGRFNSALEKALKNLRLKHHDQRNNIFAYFEENGGNPRNGEVSHDDQFRTSVLNMLITVKNKLKEA